MRWAAIAVAVLLALPARAAEAFLALDANAMVSGQGIGLTLVLRDAEAAGVVPQIRIPGLVITHDGSRNEHRRLGGKWERLQIHHYEVVAAEPGTFTIGPVEVKVAGGATVATNAVILRVDPRTASAGALEGPTATARFEPEQVYEGQIVVWTWSVLSPREILHIEAPVPAFDGLRVVPYGTPKDRIFEVSDPRGTIWRAERSLPLVAVASGRRVQPGAALRVTVPDASRSLGFGLRGDRRDVVALPSLEVEVRELPAPPPNFSGLVGDFSLRSTLDARGAAVGSSLRWRIELSGDGDVAGFALPAPPPDAAVQVYDADSGYRGMMQDGRWSATATFDRSIVPTRAGRVAIQPLELVVFSPTRGTYETLRAEVAPFDVLPGREAATPLESFAPEGTPSAPTAGPAIRPLARRGRDNAPSLGGILPLSLALVAGPGIGVFALAARERLARWQEARRLAARSPPTPAEVLRSLPGEPAERLAALDGALRLALAARAGVEVGALDRAAAVAALPDAVRQRVAHLTRTIDRARFGGEPSGDLLDETRAVVAEIGGAS